DGRSKGSAAQQTQRALRSRRSPTVSCLARCRQHANGLAFRSKALSQLEKPMARPKSPCKNGCGRMTNVRGGICTPCKRNMPKRCQALLKSGERCPTLLSEGQQRFCPECEQRRNEQKERQCENILPSGERCPDKVGRVGRRVCLSCEVIIVRAQQEQLGPECRR